MKNELTDQELEKLWEEQMDVLQEIGETIGITRSIWVADTPDDFDFNLSFSNEVLEFTNRQGGQTYILVKPKYSDVWKAFEKSLIDIGPTDHVFIELIEIRDNQLYIHTGS